MLKKAILDGRVVNACIVVLLNFLSANFVVGACSKTASVYKDNQGYRPFHICFSEVDHLVGVITIGNIFEGDRRDGSSLLCLSRQGNTDNGKECGEKAISRLRVIHREILIDRKIN